MPYFNKIIMQYLVVCGLFDVPINISDYLVLFVERLLNAVERSWRRGHDITEALSQNFP
jgi:hypothetical protein